MQSSDGGQRCLEGTSSGTEVALKVLKGPHTLLPLEQVDINEVIIPNEDLSVQSVTTWCGCVASS